MGARDRDEHGPDEPDRYGPDRDRETARGGLTYDEAALIRDAQLAERNRSMRERGRQIGGAPGAIVAGVMIALRDIYESPKRDNGSVVVDAASEPHDVDRDGLGFEAADIGADGDVTIAAQERRPPIVRRSRRRRRER